MARVIYLTNLGTIPDESFVNVKLASTGEVIGHLDETFLERMKKRDVFVLGGKKYLYNYTKGMNVYVNSAEKLSPTIPSWISETLPLSFSSAMEIGEFRYSMNRQLSSNKSKKEVIKFIMETLYVKEATAETIYNYFYEQYKFLGIPTKDTLLVERYKSDKKYLVFHSMYGRRVNDALSRALGFLVGEVEGREVEIGINDNGFYIAGEKLNIEKAFNQLTKENIESILKEAIEKTDVLARRFRHCATRSLMILRNYKGQTRTVGKQQLKSHFLMHAVRKITEDFPILREAKREVLEDLMDIENAKKVLDWIKEGRVKMKIQETQLPSPFGSNLILQGQSDLIRIEARQDFLKRIHQEHLKAIKEAME